MMLIDTDVAVDIWRGFPAALDWFDELPANETAVLAGYSVIELIQGTQDQSSLRRIKKWTDRFGVLWLSKAGCSMALEHFARYRLSHNLGAYDAFIGQTAVENNVTLYTFNTKHFSLIPGIQTAQPYARS